MKPWWLLLLPGTAFAYNYLWDFSGAVDRFEMKLDTGAYVSVGLPPVTSGTYTLPGDPTLTGSHSAVVRACSVADGCSLDSNILSFTVAPAPIPSAPVNLRLIVPVPSLNPSPAPLAFGSVKVGTTTTLSVTVINVGATAITFPGGSSMIGSTDFIYVTDNCAPGLALKASCVLSYVFKPTTVGAKAGANLLVFSGGVGSPLSINFTGTGAP